MNRRTPLMLQIATGDPRPDHPPDRRRRRRLIASRRTRSRRRLPSVRGLAQQLTINPEHRRQGLCRTDAPKAGSTSRAGPGPVRRRRRASACPTPSANAASTTPSALRRRRDRPGLPAPTRVSTASPASSRTSACRRKQHERHDRPYTSSRPQALCLRYKRKLALDHLDAAHAARRHPRHRRRQRRRQVLAVSRPARLRAADRRHARASSAATARA